MTPDNTDLIAEARAVFKRFKEELKTAEVLQTNAVVTSVWSVNQLETIIERLATALSQPAPVVGSGLGDGLLYPADQDTFRMIQAFSRALGDKLAQAEIKYGFGNEWSTDDWENKCRADLREHMDKGDPLDVAAYAAFCWAREWSTAAPPSSRSPAPVVGREEVEAIAHHQTVPPGITAARPPHRMTYRSDLKTAKEAVDAGWRPGRALDAQATLLLEAEKALEPFAAQADRAELMGLVSEETRANLNAARAVLAKLKEGKDG